MLWVEDSNHIDSEDELCTHLEEYHRRRKQFHFGGGGGRLNVIYSVIAVIYAACMNINKVLRVKYWGGGGGGGGGLGPPSPPSSYAYEYC